MHADVEKYVNGYNDAVKEYEATRTKAREEHTVNCRRTDQYWQVCNEADNVLSRKVRENWQALADSEHKLISWIGKHIEHYSEYKEHAEVILKAIPDNGEVDLIELDAIARRHDWCGVWNRFRSQAIAEGAIEEAIELQVSLNGGPWQEFFAIRLPDRRGYFNKKDAQTLFAKGISFLQFDAGDTHIKVQMKPAS